MLILVNVTWMFFVAGKENRKAHMKTHKGFKTTLYQVLTNLSYIPLGFIGFDHVIFFSKNYSFFLNNRKFWRSVHYIFYVVKIMVY